MSPEIYNEHILTEKAPAGEKQTLVKHTPDIHHVSLPMFESDALETGKLNDLTQKFFGSRAKWLAFNIDTYKSKENINIDEDSVGDKKKEKKIQMIKDRETKKMEFYCKSHPEVTNQEYEQIRKAQLEKYLRSARRAINKHYDKAVAKRFGVSKEDAKKFSDRQMDYSAASMQYVATIIDPDSGTLRLRNETELIPPSPAKVIERTNSIETDPALIHEEILRHVNAHISAELDSRNGRHDAERKLAQIQELLNKKLFKGKHGETQNIIIKSIHDNLTNTTEAIEGVDVASIDESMIPNDKHIKEMELSMRAVEINGKTFRVYTNPDIKEQAAGIIKAVKKTITENDEDGLIKAEKHVQDTHRILFAIQGNKEEKDQLANNVKNLLSDPDNQKYLAKFDESDEPMKNIDGQYVGRLIRVRNDSKNNGHETQSKNVNYTRLQFQFDQLEVPIEIIFQEMRSFSIMEFEVGKFDQKKNKYTGASHDLYKLYRTAIVAPYFIAIDPSNKNINIEKIEGETAEKIVFNLRNQTKKVK